MKKEIFESLKDKKAQKKNNIMTISTENVLEEAVKNNVEIIYFLYSCEKARVPSEKYGLPPDKIIKVKQSYIDRYSDVKSNTGFLAVAGVKRKNEKTGRGRVVVLDSIQDPLNAGAIIRSGMAFGFKSYLFYNCVYPYNEKTARASAGSIFSADIERADIDAIKKFSATHKFFVTLPEKGEPPELLKKEKRFIIVFGNEGHGVSPEIKKFVHTGVSVKHDRSKVESLNVAASAAIIFHEAGKTTG